MNRYLAFLDRWLVRHGEPVELIRVVGSATQTRNRCNVKAVVRNAADSSFAGGVATFAYLVIVSPTDLRRAKWPGGRGPATVGTGNVDGNLPSGHHPPRDWAIPTTADKVWLRGREANILEVNPVEDGGEIVKIEMKVAA